MKKPVSVALFVAVLFSTIVPVSSQRIEKGRTAADLIKPSITRNIIEFDKTEAFTEGRGVFIRWQMKTETNNVGFNVYRVSVGRKQLVNRAVVPGSTARAGDQTLYGEEYNTFDPKGGIGSLYMIESYALDGRQIPTKSFGTKYVTDLESVSGISLETLQTAARSSNGAIEETKLRLEPDLQQIVESSLLPADMETQRWVVSRPGGVKITVKNEGLYRVPSTQLHQAGFDINGDSANWRLFTNGVEQAIIIGPGSQYIEFYGKALDTSSTEFRTYYLISDTSPGKRMATKTMLPFAGTVISKNYQSSTQKKERVSYVDSIINGPEENYWGRIVTSLPPASPITFSVTGIDYLSATTKITVKMQGYSPTAHQIMVTVNGNSLGTISGAAGNTAFSGDITIPTSLLVEGSNNLGLQSSVSNDYDLFDSVSVDYTRKYQAIQNRISFPTPVRRGFDLDGFTGSNVRIFDTTYDSNPIQVVGLPVVQKGSTYSVRFPSNRSAVMYGIEDSAVFGPVNVVANNPSTLSATTNNADLVIITYGSPGFIDASEAWANYRRQQGFSAKVIDISDIYDEFSFGAHDAKAINDFLANAYENWETPPRYVLITGDASYDPKNYEGFGYWDLIPTKIVGTIHSETGSDEALADFDGDGLAEMSVGRIPARNSNDITRALAKTTAFETPAQQSFDRGATFAHDLLPNNYDFRAMSYLLRNELPPSMPANFIDRGTAGSQALLIDDLNTGKYLVNYSGHGSAGVWASSTFFSLNNVSQLTNTTNQSLFIMLTCLNGYFLRPINDSLSEGLLKSDSGGAVATWASTGLTTPDIQLIMGQRFYRQLSDGQIPRMGDLIKDAKNVLPPNADVRLSWVLLGDPMLKVR